MDYLPGQVLDCEQYLEGNLLGGLTWRAQPLEDARVAVAGDTAVLTAVVHDEVRRDTRGPRAM